ncbi:DUF2326 domain-containing protein [Sphingobium sp. DEHP117]|uniref:DUF2326 domain-containing protein n=1 Tax=Sphingobium sp. DEHP117 TaxID=2993436 RepID=UPI0027D72B4A|nr:DUF2326 domain-containing protein [Sphingobium sp. DEHP117]MDQ4418837.1 DUF2326 domain-containing protein [Sphingobium sp. DEHP117]
MIRAVRANKRGFRTVTFEAGVNLILADRSKAAGDKDTTNGLGKSTLLEIIDFCLGSNTSPDKGLRVESLAEWSFTLDLTLKGKEVSVTRSTAVPGTFEITGDTTGWLIVPEKNKDDVPVLDLKKWRSVLAWALFGLPSAANSENYHPSARSLLSYFTRNVHGAYDSPFTHFGNQKVWDIQVHNAFLLGLNWEKAARWQQLKDQKNALDALKKAIKTGAIDGELSSLGELEAQRVRLEGQLVKEAEALKTFQVLPQYREIEREANKLTEEIHQLVNANITDQRRADRYRALTAEEAAPAGDKLEALYQEAGVALPNAVKRTLDEAREFNQAIIKNRQQFIAKEIAELTAITAKNEGRIEDLTNRRAGLLMTLQGHGALEEFTRLQDLHAATRLRVDSLTTRINQVRQMTTKVDQIKVETVELKRSTELDYEDRREIWTQALTLFSDFSEHLYKSPGRLVIDIDETGYRFDVEIDGNQSEGISKMKIFCYDLMAICFARIRGLGIDFLIHDSTMFDGVDPRQRAHAIELAEQMAQKHGFQYILTLNTDMLPTADFTQGFDHNALVRLVLTDTDPSGSLLGFRF